MGQLVFQAALGGQVNLVGPNTASTLNINVPAFAGTMASLASVTSNGVTYVNSSGQPTSGSSFVFDGTNVGVGTTSPSSYGLLSVVSSTAGSAKISIQDTSGGASPAPLLQFGVNSSNGFNTADAARVWTTSPSSSTAALNFAAYSGGAPTTAQMTLTGGNVGIGISPSAKLHVYGNEIRVQQNASYYSLFDTAGTRYGYIQGGSGYLNIVSEAGSANNLTFTTNSSERMRIDSSGNVGINTTAMSGKFNITDNTGGAGLANTITLTNGVDANCYIKISGSSATDKQVQIGPSTGTAIAFQTNNTERMRIDSSGNLLVGTTSLNGTNGFSVAPSTSPYVTLNKTASGGFDAFKFQYNSTGVGSISYTNTAVAFNTSSDYRLKENITPLTGALTKVSNLKPVTYKWKSDGSDGEGFIAHELAEVCPHAVTGVKDAVDADGNPVYQGIDTSFLVATLTAAIQELKALTDAQASTITALTARITALENK
jgi:hypothetical protein